MITTRHAFDTGFAPPRDPSLEWSEATSRTVSARLAAMEHGERDHAIKRALAAVDWWTLNTIVDGRPRDMGLNEHHHLRLLIAVGHLRALVTRRREAAPKDRQFWHQRIRDLVANPTPMRGSE
jgi:hypothetical protein